MDYRADLNSYGPLVLRPLNALMATLTDLTQLTGIPAPVSFFFVDLARDF